MFMGFTSSYRQKMKELMFYKALLALNNGGAERLVTEHAANRLLAHVKSMVGIFVMG